MNQAQKCSKCQETPDDILMLICNHDMCLSCASQSFSIQNSSKNHKNKLLLCDLCYEPTELDITSVIELEKLNQQLQLNQSLNRKPQKCVLQKYNNNDSQNQQLNSSYSISSNNNQKQTANNILKPIKHSIEKENNKQMKPSILNNQFKKEQIKSHARNNSNSQIQIKNYCNQHQDEEVNYFCFDCLSNCICPECIIHGIHKTHEVQTIKKASPSVKKALIEIKEQNYQKEKLIKQQREDIQLREQKQKNIISSVKNQIHQQFENLHTLLQQREKDITESLDDIIPNTINFYEGFFQQSLSIEQQIKQINKQISDVIDLKDDIQLLDFYGSIKKDNPPQPPVFQHQKDIQINHMEVFDLFREINNIVLKFKIHLVDTSPRDRDENITKSSINLQQNFNYN